MTNSPNSAQVIIAGSETTATTLANVIYHFAKYPHVFKKLQRLIDQAMPTAEDWSYEKTKAITYIDDVLHETLRVRPALVSGGYRVTPPEGLQVDEQYIPGGVNVFVPAPTIHQDPRYWKRPEEFLPERFGELRTELGTDSAPYMPFNLGKLPPLSFFYLFIYLNLTMWGILLDSQLPFTLHRCLPMSRKTTSSRVFADIDI